MLRILRSEFVHILRSPRCSDSVGFLSDVCHVDNVVGRRAPDPNRPWGSHALAAWPNSQQYRPRDFDRLLLPQSRLEWALKIQLLRPFVAEDLLEYCD